MDTKLTINDIASHIFSNEKEFSKFTKAISEITKFYEIPEEDEKRRQLEAKSFIEAAEHDFKSAKILYESGIYSTSIYHLQQAVEKFVKAYMIQFLVLNKKEVEHYVKHDSPKAFFRLIEKFKNILSINFSILEKAYMLDSQIPSISIQETHNLEKALKLSKQQIAKMKSEEIEIKLNLAYKSLDIYENQENQGKIKANVADFLMTLRKELTDIDTSNRNQTHIREAITIIEGLREKLDGNFFITLRNHSNISALYILSLITYPHATFARYPNNFLSPEKYDTDLGIVQCFDKITDLLDKIINSWQIDFLEDKTHDQEGK